MTNSLKDYAQVFKELDLTELSVHEEGFTLTLKRKSDSFNREKESSVNEEKNESSEKSERSDAGSSATKVKAPLLGVFFSDVEGTVRKPGDNVIKGDVLCSIEAMKMMNDVKAPCDGKIIRVNAKEGDLVEYDQVLFEIE